MIDIRNALFNQLATYLEANVTGISVTGSYINAPAVFPHVSILQTLSSTYKPTLSNSGENHARVVYQIDIYTRGDNKQNSAWGIAVLVDDKMLALGFTRESMTPTPDMNNSTVFRITTRYSGIADNSGNIY